MKYLYKAQVTRAVDGDTFQADIDLGFGVWTRDITFRLYGINAPETRVNKTKGITLEEVTKGKEVKLLVENILTANKPSILINSVKDKKEKFGRYLAVVYVPVAFWNAGPYGENSTTIIDGEKYVNLNHYLAQQGLVEEVDYD